MTVKDMKDVLVVGATGHLGRRLVPALRERGKQTWLLVRPETSRTGDPAKRALLDRFRTLGARIVEGSMDDTASLERACAECDAVVSAPLCQYGVRHSAWGN